MAETIIIYAVQSRYDGAIYGMFQNKKDALKFKDENSRLFIKEYKVI